MNTEIIPLGFEIYASVNNDYGRRTITRLIDDAGDDVTILPAGFDSIPESQFEQDNDEPRFCTTSFRKICNFFSVIYLVHKGNKESHISYSTIRIVYHNETRRIFYYSISSRCSFRFYPEFLLIDSRIIIKNDGTTLCNNEYDLHLQERKDYYVACIDSRWSLIRRPSLEVVQMSEDIPNYSTNERLSCISFVDDKIVLNMYGESYLCDTTGKLLINGRYFGYRSAVTNNGPVWFNFGGLGNDIDVYDAMTYSFKYSFPFHLPKNMTKIETIASYGSDEINYSIIASKNYRYGVVYKYEGVFYEIIPPIYPFIKAVDGCKAFIATPDSKDECEYNHTNPRYGIIDNQGRVRTLFKYSKIVCSYGFFIVYGYNPFSGHIEDAYSCVLTPDCKPIWIDEEGELRIVLEDCLAEENKRKYIILIENLGKVVGRYYVTPNGAITKI